MNSRIARSGSIRWFSAPGQGTKCEEPVNVRIKGFVRTFKG